jgi:hypothetical protein
MNKTDDDFEAFMSGMAQFITKAFSIPPSIVGTIAETLDNAYHPQGPVLDSTARVIDDEQKALAAPREEQP